MGLTPDQLLLVEEFVEDLKGARVQEERVVVQMQQRVRLGGGARSSSAATPLGPDATHAPFDAPTDG